MGVDVSIESTGMRTGVTGEHLLTSSLPGLSRGPCRLEKGWQVDCRCLGSSV